MNGQLASSTEMTWLVGSTEVSRYDGRLPPVKLFIFLKGFARAIEKKKGQFNVTKI